MSSFKNPRAGLREEESRPSASAGGCPIVYGGGKNCCVGRQNVGLREHDYCILVPDTDCVGGLRLRGGGKEDEKRQIFHPRATLARSPVQGEGSSPHIDLNTAAIQIVPRGQSSGPPRDASGRFLPRGQVKECPLEEASHSRQLMAVYAERGEPPNEESALPPVQEGGQEARFEKVAQVVLTRLDEGFLVPGDLAQDTDETMYTVKSVSPASAGVGADLEGQRPFSGDGANAPQPSNKNTKGRRRARTHVPTPFKFGDPMGARESSVDSPMPRSETEDSPGSAVATNEVERGPHFTDADSQPLHGRLCQKPRKRPRLQDDEDEEEESSQSTASGSSLSALRGRGLPPADIAKAKEAYRAARDDLQAERPPKTVHYFGLTSAQALLNATRDEATRLQAEAKIADRAAVAAAARRKRRLRPESSVTDAADKSAHDLVAQVLDDVAIINRVALTSGNLKGTFVRALKEAATSIQKSVEEFSVRTISEETKRLQADNVRLKAEMASLREEMAKLKTDMERSRNQGSPALSQPVLTDGTSPDRPVNHADLQEFSRAMMVTLGTMMDAKLDGRLLSQPITRPTLAADRRRQAALDAANLPATEVPTPGQSRPVERIMTQPTRTTTQTGPESFSGPVYKSRPRVIVATASTGPTIDPSNKDEGRKKKQRRKKRTLAAVEASAPRSAEVSDASRSLPPASKNTKGSWSVVAGKGAKRTNRAKGSLPARSEARKLRPPRSAAIVLTLKPEAQQQGVTYAKVMAEARSRVNLAELGIEGVRFKMAATGARVLELPGATSGEKADSLAKALREALRDGVVRVDRPNKTADMRLAGLDDSVDANDVVAAVVEAAECPAPFVKCGEIRRDPKGLGSVMVRCPVAAAKKVCGAGRLKVGWVMAQVKLLPTRPMRCYRCLELGHVRALCNADADRSGICYRCGQSGHKAGQCRGEPHCVLCAAAGKAANHRTGSKSCNPPKMAKRNKKKAGDGPGAPSPLSCPPASAEAGDEAAPMDATQ